MGNHRKVPVGQEAQAHEKAGVGAQRKGDRTTQGYGDEGEAEMGTQRRRKRKKRRSISFCLATPHLALYPQR